MEVEEQKATYMKKAVSIYEALAGVKIAEGGYLFEYHILFQTNSIAKVISLIEAATHLENIALDKKTAEWHQPYVMSFQHNKTDDTWLVQIIDPYLD